MTLTRQLWIAIIAIVLLNGSVSFWLLFTTTHRTFEEQLYLKNIDDANALALLLTQSEKSQTNMELLIAAKFNAGNYASIRLIDMDGNMISEFSYTEEELDTVPQWFAGIVHFAIPAGVSQVSEGWGQYGTLYVENQTTYALELFWLKFRRFILSLTLVTVLVGMIGSMLLRSILKPLGKIVQQANSFSQRRFVTLDRPWTEDFARVVDAMNSLAERFKTIVLENNARLELGRFKSQHDPVTTLPNISAFFTLLESQLRYRDKDGQNTLIVHSVACEHYDIQSVLAGSFNEFFREFSARVIAFYEQHQTLYTDFRAARINETDIAIILTDSTPLEHLQQKIAEFASFSIAIVELKQTATLATAGVYIKGNEASHELMFRVDDMLEQAQQMTGQFTFCFEPLPDDKLQLKPSDWPNFFAQIEHAFSLHTVPVLTTDETVRHFQTFFNVKVNNVVRGCSYFTRSARESSAIPSIDLKLVNLVVAHLESHPDQKLSLLLYQETIQDSDAINKIEAIIKKFPAASKRLALELRESTARLCHDEYKHFCTLMKHYQVGLGLKRVGESFSQVANVHEFGLDYIKVDSAYVYDVKNNQVNQIYLRGLSDLAHSLGMKVYADGVLTESDEEVLFSLGFDGVIRMQQ
ncbi:MAG: hypothetical protein CL589_04775 [Alteromonadaceae bacterium]|nr:hypothetical protein [Alteromonadaceae bacterium]MAX41942.1 hypothetical protein [Alteromonadaceae bacterium]|tara:strand:- start:2864 stop:4777 length:1914 start_codon:yes stop_codon:yes gene_type:complete